MDTKLHPERLFALIHKFGAEAQEARQVARRLGDLLLVRFQTLRREHAKQGVGAAGERAALLDERYLAYIDEYCEVAHKSLMSRIQYDTHLMLFKARQTLRRYPETRRSPRSY